jgi:hypothetical protein
MATLEAIAKMQDQAFASMLYSMNRLAAVVEVKPVDVQAIYYPDPAYQRAEQLKALAGWLSQVTEAIASPEQAAELEPLEGEPSVLESRSVKELRAYAEEHGIDLGDAKKKAELIAVLESALAESSTAETQE